MGISWSMFDAFEPIIEKYMPMRGEGETMASQIATAVNKLVYKWYNDGDVYDNTYKLAGWANDLSTYANWLHTYATECDTILEGIADCEDGYDYECLLYDLASCTLNSNYLAMYENSPKEDSIYKCKGPYQFVEYDEDDDDEYDW